jgi:hypothetical protein
MTLSSTAAYAGVDARRAPELVTECLLAEGAVLEGCAAWRPMSIVGGALETHGLYAA